MHGDESFKGCTMFSFLHVDPSCLYMGQTLGESTCIKRCLSVWQGGGRKPVWSRGGSGV